MPYRRHPRSRIFAALATSVTLAALIALAGCTAARMPVDDTAGMDFYPAEGRQGWKIRERLRFGPYEALAIERSWTRGSGVIVNPVELDRRRQEVRFTLADTGEDRFDVTCRVRFGRGAITTNVVDVEFRNASEVTCDVVPVEAGAPMWTLELAETRERPLRGILSTRAVTYEVEGTNKLRKGLPMQTVTGYYLRDGERELAAVEVVNAGGLWMRADAPDRAVLAAAASALLLLEDLLGTRSEA